MSSNLLLNIGKSHQKIQNGVFYCVRMCYQGQTSNQSQEATYGAPEYFQYNEYSFNDIHAEMAKYRLPRPSSKTDKEVKK